MKNSYSYSEDFVRWLDSSEDGKNTVRQAVSKIVLSEYIQRPLFELRNNYAKKDIFENSGTDPEEARKRAFEKGINYAIEYILNIPNFGPKGAQPSGPLEAFAYLDKNKQE